MRTVGIVRVSEAKGREGDSFASPSEQRQRISEACERDGMELVAVHEEIDVSGGAALERRDGLRAAVESVEGKQADVLMVAYFDRLVRSLRVQDEVVSRVEAAGGRVVALDFGRVTGETAAQWISGTMLGVVSEYYRRSVKERVGSAQAMAVARGVVPWPNIPPGYRRGSDGILVPTDEAPVVDEGFRLRLDHIPLTDLRRFWRERGIVRSYHGVQSMLASRLYLGEIHFGGLVNLSAHEPIIDRDVWQAVQRVRTARGPRPSSDRLLARLGVLRCGTCGARMVVGTQTQNGRSYPFYRCPPVGDCPRRVTISAEIAERVVVEAVLGRHGEATGRASAEHRAREAAGKAERAQADLDSAIRTFAGLEDETAVRERLSELVRVRDESAEEAAHLGHLHSALVLNLARDWDDLRPELRRRVIQAAVEVATVGPGRGAERVSVTLRD